MPEKKSKLLSMHVDSPLWEKVDAALKKEIATRNPKKADIERAGKITELLFEEFPNVQCALHFRSPLQLLVATILSAQCTDERVNRVTPALFEKYRTVEDFARSPEGELEEDIRSTGFFNNKARSIREASRTIISEFGGEVPEAMEDLLRLRGTARKTANVVRMHAFNLPGLSVDTHFLRVTYRLGLTRSIDAKKVEADVGALLPPEIWTDFSGAIILHGRKTCTAHKPKCGECRLAALCPSAFKAEGNPGTNAARARRAARG